MTLPRLELASYRGDRVSARDLRGHVVLLTLLDSQCTEACPTLAWVIARTIDRLSSEERGQVRAVAITGDPAEDTPASVRRFLAARRAEGRLDYLLGSERQLRTALVGAEAAALARYGSGHAPLGPASDLRREGVRAATLHVSVDLSEENLIRTALAEGRRHFEVRR